MVTLLVAGFFTITQHPIHIQDAQDEPLRTSLQRDVDKGVARVERFFGKPFPKPFTVEVLPSRAAFDKVFKERWGIDHSELWAVAAGVSDAFYILTPRVWKTEAVEHDPNNAGHIRRIIAHELTHVYHGQLNPSKDFEGMDDLGWLVEGLATYVSGQLDEEHRSEDLEAIRKHKEPKALKDAWSGRYRYAVSGSLVRYVDRRFGRKKLVSLLPLTKPADVLNSLRISEAGLLKSWRASVTASPLRGTPFWSNRRR